MTTTAHSPENQPGTFVYHPRTADHLEISPTPDGLGVLIGIYNNRDGGQYTTVEVSLPDIQRVFLALDTAYEEAKRTQKADK